MKNNKLFGFSDDDLTFLFGKHKDKAVKSLEALSEKHPEYTDYDALDVMSCGHGREAYVKLSNHRLKSEEYMSTFQIINNSKFLDLETSEGKDRHIYRNKNQFNKAPKDLKTMYEFVKRGYFINEGYNPCHNMKTDDPTSRKASVSRMIYLVKRNLLMDSKESGLGNISFRGTPGSSFEGCQFIYNDKTGKLVTDCINRGTWDYGKYGTPSHYVFDVEPWIKEGNGNNIETPEMFIMSMKDEQLYLKTSFKNIESKKAGNLGTATAAAIKEGMSSESITGVSAVFVNNERKRAHEKSIEECCINFIERCDEMPLSFLDADWHNYISFCTMVDDKTLIKGLEMFVTSMESDPYDLKDLISDENKNKYKQFLLKSSMVCIEQGKLKAGMELKNDMPITLKINMNSGFSTRLKECGNQDEAIKEFHKIRDEIIIPCISEKLATIGFKCRILDDVTGPDSFDSFILTISQLRVVSKEEEILVTNAQNKVTPKEEFAKEELNTYHAPEYSLEGVFGTVLTGIVASTFVIGVVSIIVLLFDKLIWSKNRKIIKIIQENIGILEEPINKDYASYTLLYNKFIKDASFINGLYTEDKYGKYQYTTENSRFSKDSFLRVSAQDFGNDIVTKIFYAIKACKNKYPKEIKAIFDNIKYSYVVAEGKPLLELVTEYNGMSTTKYDPVTGKYTEDPSLKTNKTFTAGGLVGSYKPIKKLIASECDKASRKGFEIVPVFMVNNCADYTNNGEALQANVDNEINIDVAFYLCMPTSIDYEKFITLKNIVETKMAEENK